MIQTYVKKPPVLEAIQLQSSIESQNEIIEWSNNTIEKGTDGKLIIPTLDGVIVADVGDYIIKDENGEFYTCKPDVFSKSYNLVFY